MPIRHKRWSWTIRFLSMSHDVVQHELSGEQMLTCWIRPLGLVRLFVFLPKAPNARRYPKNWKRSYVSWHWNVSHVDSLIKITFNVVQTEIFILSIFILNTTSSWSTRIHASNVPVICKISVVRQDIGTLGYCIPAGMMHMTYMIYWIYWSTRSNKKKFSRFFSPATAPIRFLSPRTW